MNRSPRVVFDTNVVLSALIFSHGRLAPLRGLWRSGRCQPLVSSATAAELLRAIAYPKFKLGVDDQQELLADYLPFCESVRISTPPPPTPVCRDPMDVPFLHLAYSGTAEFLVTGDQDLLALKPDLPFAIITPDNLMTELKSISPR